MKTAFFDLTGTLLKESSIQQYLNFLARNGFLDAKALKHLSKIHEEHKKHHFTELQTSQHILRELAHALKGVPTKRFDFENRQFVANENVPLYPYTLGLIGELKEKGYELVSVSGAPDNLVKPVAKALGLDTAFGSQFEVEKGRFTGRLSLDLTQPHEKRRIVEAYAAKRHGVLEQCFCFGDMVLDEEMMSVVGHAVALNAGPALRRACKRNGWLQLNENQVLKTINRLA